jgi:hypothetical protein
MGIAAYFRKDRPRDQLLYLNRKIALYAILQCWVGGLDGIVFEYEYLKRFYQVDAVRRSRIDIFIEDIGWLFPHCKILANYRFSRKTLRSEMSHPSVWACRMPFDKALPKGRMMTNQRLKVMKDKRPFFGRFEMWDEPDSLQFREMTLNNPFYGHSCNEDEEFLSAYLRGVAAGSVSFGAIPPFKRVLTKVRAEKKN